MSQTVLVTGATGFIAQYIIDELLKQDYTVIGTVRTKAKGDNLIRLFHNDNFSYEVVKDLANSKDDFDNVLKGHPELEIVIHTASPVLIDTTDEEQDIIYPAINGAVNAIDSAHRLGKNVKRFVFTSSVAAVHSRDRTTSDFVDTENSWNNVVWEKGTQIDKWKAYVISKTYAEKEIWNYVKNNDVQFDLSVICPSYVFGPQLFEEAASDVNASNSFVVDLITANEEDYKQVQGHFIDVKDVALAHLYAFQKANTIGKRLLLSESEFNQQTLLDIINAQFPQLKGKIPRGNPGSDKEVLEKSVIVDNSKTKKILGFKFKQLGETVHETIEQALRVNGIDSF